MYVKVVSFITTMCLLISFMAPLSAGATPTTPVTVEIGQAKGARGDTVQVAVYMDPGDDPFWKYDLNVAYDPDVLELLDGMQVTDDASSQTFATDTSTSGVVNVKGSRFGALDFLFEKQAMFTIHFKIRQTAPSGDTDVTLYSGSYVSDVDPAVISAVTPGKVTVSDTAALSIGSVSGGVGQMAAAGIYLDSASAGVGSYGMRIGFNPAALEVSSITGESGDTFVSGFNNAGGSLAVAWADVTGGDRPVTAGRKLFTVNFKVKPGTAAGDQFPLTVTSPSELDSFSVTDTSGKEMIKTIKAGSVIVGLTVTASDPTGEGTDGKTKVSVAEPAEAGNTFKYKNFAGGAVSVPNIGDSIGADYADLPADGLIAAANGDKIVVAEVSAAGKAVKLGQTTAIVANEPVAGLAAPANLTAAAGDGRAGLSWNSVTGATYYNVYMSTATGAYSGMPAATVTGTTYSYTASGLTNGQAYYFVVKAGNALGVSANSNEASAVPQAASKPDEDNHTGGGSGSGSSSSKESIAVHVQNGGDRNGTVVATIFISRTTAADGSKKDEVTFTPDQVNKTIEQLKAAGSELAKIVIPDQKDEVAELNVNIPRAAGEQLAKNKIHLEIFTNHTRVVIPFSSLQGLTGDAYFRIVPVKKEKERKEIEQRASTEQAVRQAAGSGKVTVIGRPMEIETNIQSRPVTLVLPLGNASLDEKQLGNLGIFIEHSDGTKEWVRGEIVAYDEAGRKGITFTINKFSTFTILHIEREQANKPHQAYIQGYADGTFGPERSITRAEMAAILTRLAGQTEKRAGQTYKDVDAAHWAKESIARATKAGLMDGYPDGSFKPDQTMTRAEMAVIATRMKEAVRSSNGGTRSFPDVSGHWAQSAIEQAQAAGIIGGYEDGTFRPDRTLTRAETVAIVSRLLGRAPLTGAAPKWTDVPQGHWAFGLIQEASTDHAYEVKSRVEQYMPEL